jgi:predicted chitinase
MTKQQVDGQVVILNHWEDQDSYDDLRWLAYMLATVYHECAKKMWPIREIGRGKGRKYGKPDENGNVYYGRGFVQLTWKENYAKASNALGLIDDRDLVDHPDVALDSFLAARIMFRGMAEGWFTSRKLGHYFNDAEDDPIDARRIINTDVSKNGKRVAGYHKKFLAALKEAT